jgi:hypothetical protein
VPLGKDAAKKKVRQLLDEGTFVVSPHARTERDKDGLTDVDIVNVLRGGIVDEPEWENGSWRYRVRTAKITVVVAFDPEPEEAGDDEIELVVVTVWRLVR